MADHQQGTRAVDKKIIRQGFLLLLLAFLGALAGPFTANPRMGLSAHLVGLFGGLILIALGATKQVFVLSPRLWSTMHWCWLAATYGNWGNALLAAATGSSRLTPIAGAGTTGTFLAEAVVFAFFVVVGLTSIIAAAIGVYGLYRSHEAE